MFLTSCVSVSDILGLGSWQAANFPWLCIRLADKYMVASQQRHHYHSPLSFAASVCCWCIFFVTLAHLFWQLTKCHAFLIVSTYKESEVIYCSHESLETVAPSPPKDCVFPIDIHGLILLENQCHGIVMYLLGRLDNYLLLILYPWYGVTGLLLSAAAPPTASAGALVLASSSAQEARVQVLQPSTWTLATLIGSFVWVVSSPTR